MENKNSLLWIRSGDKLNQSSGVDLSSWNVEFYDGSGDSLRIDQSKYDAVVVEPGEQSAKPDYWQSLYSKISELGAVAIVRSDCKSDILPAVNAARSVAILSNPSDKDQLLESLERAAKSTQKKRFDSGVVKNFKIQNLKLVELTKGLEKAVEDRTKHLADSKREIEGNVSRIRSMNQFVKELSSLLSIEDLLVLIKKSVKNFHHVKPPILSIKNANGQLQILHFQGSLLSILKPKELWPQSLRLKVNDKEGSQYLANTFGRPVAKLISIPLAFRSNDSGAQPQSMATLFFEHSLSDEHRDLFLNFLGERLQTLSLSLDRLMLESELREASFVWEQTFDGLDEPVAIVDLDYNLLRANKSFSPKLNNEKCFASFTQGQGICEGCPIGSVFKTLEAGEGMIERGGRRYQVHSYPIRFGKGPHTTTVVNHYTDVTHERELQGRLIQSEKMAAIGHLAGNIAHELNNPLTGVRSMAQILKLKLNEKDTAFQDLGEIEIAAHRCQKIIENLLDFSTGGDSDKSRTVSLSEVISRTLPLLKTAMRSHNCEVIESDEELLVKVEPHLLQQVVFNLVNNSCQAMTKKGTISIETRVLKNKNMAELEVRDTGPGVPDEIKERLFEPFFTTKSEGQGTGLGLSMSQTIVEQFGGEIGLSSTEQGARFFIRLPLHVEGAL